MPIVLDHLPSQDEFYNAQDGEVAFIAGLGLGKTMTASDWVLTGLTQYPHIRPSVRAKVAGGHFIFSNTYEQLRDGTLRSFFERIEDVWLAADPRFEYVDRVRDLHEIHFPRLGAVVNVRSMDKPINFKSLEICRAWIDEGQAYTKDAYDKIVGRLRGTSTQRRRYPSMPLQIRITANPPHTMDHWLVDLTTKPNQKTGKPPIRLITGTTYDNPFLPQDYIDRLEATYDPEIAEAELRGKFIEIGKGRIFRRFAKSKHVLTPEEAARRGLPPLEYDPSLPLCWSHDFNLDPLCSVLFQWRTVRAEGYQRVVMYVLDIIRVEHALIENAVQALIDRPEAAKIARRNGIILYGDAAGNQGNRQTGVSDWVALKTELARQGFSGPEPRVPDANPERRSRFAAANRMLENAKGEIGVVMLESTTGHLVTDCTRMYFKPGTFDVEIPKAKPGEIIPPSRKLTHLGDAFSYPIHFDYPYTEDAPRLVSTGR